MRTLTPEANDGAGRPLGYQTLTEAVYRQLRLDILSGTLPPGERLDQDRICRDFGISRTPLREVLRRLEAEGLVQIRFHRGAVVSILDMRQIQEIYDIRAELEGFAARLGTQHRTGQDVATLKACFTEMTRLTAALEFDRLLDIHRDFHMAVYTPGGNQQLLDLVRELRNRCEWFRRVHIGVPNRARTTLSEHLAILEAFEAGDTERVEALVHANVADTASTLAHYLDGSRREPAGTEHTQS